MSSNAYYTSGSQPWKHGGPPKINGNTVKLGYNENSVITNKHLGKIGNFSTQMNPVITNKNVRSRAARYNRV